MDLDNAGPSPDASRTEQLPRRSLIARVGAAGLAGLAAAVVAERSAAAGAEESSTRPDLPTEADLTVLQSVVGLESAASELYLARLDAVGSPDDDVATLIGIMADNHQGYAQAIAGATGFSAQDADTAEVFDAYVDRFTGSADDFLAAAHELEQIAVATHTELIADYESTDAIALASSIVVVEARHATVLADLLEVDDLDIVLGNTQSALTLSGDDA